jgi:ABC-2 type transport system permease protein
MTKLLAIVKREYTQRVRSRMFIVTTVLLPVGIALFGVLPALVANIELGNPMRIVVMDSTGKLFGRLKSSLEDNKEAAVVPEANPSKPPNQFDNKNPKFFLEDAAVGGRSQNDVKSELERRLQAKQIDAFLILPADLLQTGKAQLYRRNTSDLFSTGQIQEALDKSVRELRLIEAHVDSKTMSELARPVIFETTRISGSGSERDSGSGFALVFASGFLMYISVLLYGQVVLGAVIEEKETRIAEVLFSSVRPFTLMIGKLLGVSLVALTQLTIWGVAFGAFALYGVGILASRGIPATIPNIPISFYIYFALFFLSGYFVYSTLYALVGSLVTTAQEGGQVAMPIILMLVVSFYFFLPVSRAPDSRLSFWLSMIPFFAPGQHVGAHCYADPAVLADSVVAPDRLRYSYFTHVACVANLSNWDVDVREATDNS